MVDTINIFNFINVIIKMPRCCSVYECHGNYDGEPYTKQVSFPTNESTRSKWIAAMPNDAASLTKKKEIYTF